MEKTRGIFQVENAFSLTGLGLVLVGQLIQREAAAGNVLVLEGGPRWQIRAINPLQHRTHAAVVELLVAAPAASRQALRDAGILGATALVFAA